MERYDEQLNGKLLRLADWFIDRAMVIREEIPSAADVTDLFRDSFDALRPDVVRHGSQIYFVVKAEGGNPYYTPSIDRAIEIAKRAA